MDSHQNKTGINADLNEMVSCKHVGGSFNSNGLIQGFIAGAFLDEAECVQRVGDCDVRCCCNLPPRPDWRSVLTQSEVAARDVLIRSSYQTHSVNLF